MKGITVPELYIQLSSGNYFPKLWDDLQTDLDQLNSISGDTRPYKVYVANFTQSGTNEIVFNVLENTASITLVGARQLPGMHPQAIYSSELLLNMSKMVAFINGANSGGAVAQLFFKNRFFLVGETVFLDILCSTHAGDFVDNFEGSLEIRAYV